MIGGKMENVITVKFDIDKILLWLRGDGEDDYVWDKFNEAVDKYHDDERKKDKD